MGTCATRRDKNKVKEPANRKHADVVLDADIGEISEASQRLDMAIEFLEKLKTKHPSEYDPGLDEIMDLLNETRHQVVLMEANTEANEVEKLEIRRDFLLKAAEDEYVRPEERAMARWITDTILTSSPGSKGVNAEGKDEDEQRLRSILVKRHLHSLSSTLDCDDPTQVTTTVKSLLQDEELTLLVSKIQTWDFDVFAVHNFCEDYILTALGNVIYSKMGYKELGINLQIFNDFMYTIAKGYHPENLYHNVIHAADVFVSLYYYLHSERFATVSQLDSFAALCAAACHDVDHPGGLPGFQIERETDLAILYNDQSVLENHHASLSWRLLKQHDFIANFSAEQRKRFRRIFILCIRCTDMTMHTDHTKFLDELPRPELSDAGKVKHPDLTPHQMEYLLSLAVHAADISNPTKPTPLTAKWADLVMNEYFGQGDRERELGLKISNLCDRKTVEIPTAQLGFLNFVVRPFFLLWNDIFVDIGGLFLEHLDRNKQYWERVLKEKHLEKHSSLMQAVKRDLIKNGPGRKGSLSDDTDRVEDVKSSERISRIKSIILTDHNYEFKSPSLVLTRSLTRTTSVNNENMNKRLSSRSRGPSLSPDNVDKFNFSPLSKKTPNSPSMDSIADTGDFTATLSDREDLEVLETD